MSPVDHDNSSVLSVRHRTSALLREPTSSTDLGAKAPEHGSTETSEASPTFKTTSDGPSSGSNNSSSTSARAAETLLSGTPPTTQSTARELGHGKKFCLSNLLDSPYVMKFSEIDSLTTQQPGVPMEESSTLTLLNCHQTPASVSDIRQQLDGFHPSDDEHRRLLLELLSHRDLKPHIHDLQEAELREFIELLDNVSETDIHPHQC
jgi:hypothetical protein